LEVILGMSVIPFIDWRLNAADLKRGRPHHGLASPIVPAPAPATNDALADARHPGLSRFPARRNPAGPARSSPTPPTDFSTTVTILYRINSTPRLRATVATQQPGTIGIAHLALFDQDTRDKYTLAALAGAASPAPR
jgi:hypothetical protein